MTNGRNANGVELSWQNIVLTIGLVLSMVGGFWYLAYIPIQRNLDDLKQQISELRGVQTQQYATDEAKFLTQKEHNEFKQNVRDADAKAQTEIKDILRLVDKQREEALTRSDAQQLLNTTRLEFRAEITRLNELTKNNMDRREFEAWRGERDKVISIMQDRQNRFSEALDSLYAKITTQPSTYQQKQ